jgi:microcystin degradation protein MlrC
LHGSAAAENALDLEGDLIGAVRQVVGPTVPIVATLDLHAHVTADMVRFADALIAWETYPHRDAFTTGVRGACLLLDILAGRCRPTMAMAKVPVLTGAIRGSTEGNDPFAQLMRLTKSHEGRDGVLSASLFLVHPYLDQPGMGSGPIVITDNDMEKAVGIARRIAEQYWARRFELEPELFTPDEAVTRGLRIDGPVLLVEAADCCGGGAAGDSVATLKVLLRADVPQTSLVPVVDPVAAEVCHRAGVGGTVTLPLGHQRDPRWGQPVTVTGRVTRLSDGRFRYAGGVWDKVESSMGPAAVLSIGAVQVLVASHATYDWMDEQFRAMQLNPSEAKFIVAKNPMNYRMAYSSLVKRTFILDTPGPTPPTLRHVQYRHLTRPYFPLDEEIPGLAPTTLS